jgi:hypothetical protein
MNSKRKNEDSLFMSESLDSFRFSQVEKPANEEKFVDQVQELSIGGRPSHRTKAAPTTEKGKGPERRGPTRIGRDDSDVELAIDDDGSDDDRGSKRKLPSKCSGVDVTWNSDDMETEEEEEEEIVINYPTFVKAAMKKNGSGDSNPKARSDKPNGGGNDKAANVGKQQRPLNYAVEDIRRTKTRLSRLRSQVTIALLPRRAPRAASRPAKDRPRRSVTRNRTTARQRKRH